MRMLPCASGVMSPAGGGQTSGATGRSAMPLNSSGLAALAGFPLSTASVSSPIPGSKPGMPPPPGAFTCVSSLPMIARFPITLRHVTLLVNSATFGNGDASERPAVSSPNAVPSGPMCALSPKPRLSGVVWPPPTAKMPPPSAAAGVTSAAASAASAAARRLDILPPPSQLTGRLYDCRRPRASVGAMPLTVGTAGHIDHGKTWLVRALTGKDTDRLPEERERGISIDLGYAPLELPDGRRLSLVDVPGHERFVRTMVAGATGIDLFLLVIDAGEGARPQTHEHLAVLRLLGVERGVVAVTKADAVDAETLELALAEAHELVPGAPAVPVSARTGAGLDELRAALARAADRVDHSEAAGGTRLFVDRVFSLRGIGTVATGTLWSGSIADGDELRVEPSGLEVRVRSVQVHDEPVKRAEAGQRVAVALPGVDRARLERGDALVESGAFVSS